MDIEQEFVILAKKHIALLEERITDLARREAASSEELDALRKARKEVKHQIATRASLKGRAR